MASPLLATKLFVPAVRSDLVERPRLAARLRENLARPVTLISAPAGFGKTTLICAGLAGASSGAAAWLSLDADDNDPVRFWVYAITALQTLQPGLGQDELRLLEAAQPPPAKAILTSLLNQLAALPDGGAASPPRRGDPRPATRPRVLILDDYHVIEARPIHEALAFLVDYLPPGLRLVITTRADPPLPLARWRARGQLGEIRADDLRFTAEEAAAFVAQTTGLPLAADETAALAARTEGWAAGLQLAALSLKDRTDRAAFIAAFAGSHRYIVDYLADEVLGGLPEATQRFLLETSILERLSGELCDAVTGGANGQAVLEGLERDNLFVAPLDEARRWYRYHQLFAEALRSRLRALLPGRAPELHRRASAWFEQQGLAEEAVAHALAGGDYERAAHLIERNAGGLLDRGQHATLQAWLKRLPEGLARARPHLGLIRVSVFTAAHDLDAAQRYLEDAEQAALAEPSERREGLLAEAAASGAGLALNRGDYPDAIRLARRALERLPADSLRQRGEVTLHLGLALSWNGDPGAAGRAYVEAATLAQAADDAHTAALAAFNAGALLHARGRLRQAAATYRQVLRRAASRGPGHDLLAGVGYAHTYLGELSLEWNDLEAAAEHLGRAIASGERAERPRTLVVAYGYLARVALGQGDTAAAQAALAKATHLIHKHSLPSRYAGSVAVAQVRLWLALGEPAAAVAWARASGLSPADQSLPVTREEEYLALARVLTAQGQGAAAAGLLERLRQEADAVGRANSVVWILALLAPVLQANGDGDGAARVLAQALAVAEPEGYVRTFVDEGEPMRALLRARQAPAGRPADYVEKLLAAFEGRVHAPAVQPASSARAPAAPAQPLIEALSAREVEVARLMAAGLSNAEIAQRLVVGMGTVKTHVNHIFRKLDATSRTQAVARARALGLLDG